MPLSSDEELSRRLHLALYGTTRSQPSEARNDRTMGHSDAQEYHPDDWDEGLSRDVTLSKVLTKVLRHDALDLGVNMQADGFCDVAEVTALDRLRKLKCTLSDIEKVVQESDKQRFQLKEEEGRHFIRAVQGHTIRLVDDRLLLRRLNLEDEELPLCVHGTYHSRMDSIIESGGLRTCGRNHIHFTSSFPRDRRVISGMRHDCDVAIWIALRLALRDGVPFYMSVNEVILSPGIEGLVALKYFDRAEHLKTKNSHPMEILAKTLKTK